MAEIPNKDTNEFITRYDFVEWVVNPTAELDLYWTQFLHDNPSSKTNIDEAIFIIKNITRDEIQLNNTKKEKLWNSIEERTIGKNRSRWLSSWSIAAGLIVLLGFSSLFYFIVNSGNEITDYKSIVKADGVSNDVKLIFSDNSEQVFSSNNLEIKYNRNGEIEVRTENGKKSTDFIARSLKVETKKQKRTSVPLFEGSSQEQMNQLVVPRGKRTSLTLSDGTRLYLNSGSRAIFPVKFTKDKRELFVEGEAYIEVTPDSRRPFVVVTNEMSINVLGTKFNVTAYPEDSYCSVVLVEGKVQAEINSQEIVMNPNHLLLFQKETKIHTLEKTEVMTYISWKDGWLYCKNEKLSVVADKLSRYYDIKIEFEDKETPELIMYGKLDLKSECSEIFKAISSIAPISCDISEKKIIVSKKVDKN